MDNVIVRLDDTEHPETFCEVSVGGTLCVRVSEAEGDRVRRLITTAESANGFEEITGISGERHVYPVSWIIGVSTSTKASRHAATLREMQEEDEMCATRKLAGRTFDS
jgi:hypothetical protein